MPSVKIEKTEMVFFCLFREWKVKEPVILPVSNNTLSAVFFDHSYIFLIILTSSMESCCSIALKNLPPVHCPCPGGGGGFIGVCFVWFFYWFATNLFVEKAKRKI